MNTYYSVDISIPVQFSSSGISKTKAEIGNLQQILCIYVCDNLDQLRKAVKLKPTWGRRRPCAQASRLQRLFRGTPVSRVGGDVTPRKTICRSMTCLFCK